MTDLEHIIDGVPPNRLPQVGFELTDRRKTQHALFVVLALCILGLYAQVGQAGIGGIDQVQVSNHSPVPQHAVPQQIENLASAVLRLAAAVETMQKGLGVPAEPRYTPPPELVGEAEMATMLGIPRRTLTDHRKLGRLPGCWVKNGRRILWLAETTKNAWREGIV